MNDGLVSLMFVGYVGTGKESRVQAGEHVLSAAPRIVLVESAEPREGWLHPTKPHPSSSPHDTEISPPLLQLEEEVGQRILPKMVRPVAFEPPTKPAAQGIVRASCAHRDPHYNWFMRVIVRASYPPSSAATPSSTSR